MDSLTIGMLLSALVALIGIAGGIISIKKSVTEGAKREGKSEALLDAIKSDLDTIKTDISQVKEEGVEWRFFKQTIEFEIKELKHKIEALEAR